MKTIPDGSNSRTRGWQATLDKQLMAKYSGSRLEDKIVLSCEQETPANLRGVGGVYLKVAPSRGWVCWMARPGRPRTMEVKMVQEELRVKVEKRAK